MPRPAFLAWLRSFAPVPLAAGRHDLWLGSLGAGLALLLTEWLGRLVLGTAQPWFIAPMGASAVLLFALPASPLAQPWAVLAGNVLSASVGVACYEWLGATPEAAALAATGAIALMFALRCLHPPGGAVALTAVLGGPAIHQLGFRFAWGLVAGNALLMAVVALVLHNLMGRRYPHVAAPKPHPHGTRDPLPSARLLAKEDFDAALAGYGERLDVGVDDLEEILVRAQVHAGQRRFGAIRCRDIMARDVVTASPADSLEQAWRRLGEHRVQALPVVDAQRRLVGIVSLHDFFVDAAPAADAGLPRPSTARRVEQIMTRSVRVARPDGALADLVEAFSDGGLHHLPVIDGEDRVLGMVTQSDVVAALFVAQPALASARPQAARSAPAGNARAVAG